MSHLNECDENFTQRRNVFAKYLKLNWKLPKTSPYITWTDDSIQFYYTLYYIATVWSNNVWWCWCWSDTILVQYKCENSFMVSVLISTMLYLNSEILNQCNYHQNDNP